MSTGLMVVIIVAIAVAGIVRIAKIIAESESNKRHSSSQTQPTARQPLDSESQRELAELRERVKVLERIATDSNEPQRLASEIEALRESKSSD